MSTLDKICVQRRTADKNDYIQTMWLKQQAVSNGLHKHLRTNFLQMRKMEATWPSSWVPRLEIWCLLV